jgi:transposase
MGHDRPPVENPDRIEEVLPEKCKHCGTALPQASEERQTVGDVFRRQIVDLPEVIVPVVTEYQYPKLVCPDCQKGTRAELRPEHEHEIGERLTAAISYLIVSRKMTRRDVSATMQDLFGVDISVGSVQKAWEETADAVEAPYTELEQALPSEPVLNADETGSRTNGDKRWVWVLCSSWFVFYHIASNRGVEVLVQLLGKAFAGILVTTVAWSSSAGHTCNAPSRGSGSSPPRQMPCISLATCFPPWAGCLTCGTGSAARRGPAKAC